MQSSGSILNVGCTGSYDGNTIPQVEDMFYTGETSVYVCSFAVMETTMIKHIPFTGNISFYSKIITPAVFVTVNPYIQLRFIDVRYRMMCGMNGVLRTGVIFALVANEALSIIENLGLMGLPLPDALMQAIEQLHGKSDPEKNKEE